MNLVQTDVQSSRPPLKNMKNTKWHRHKLGNADNNKKYHSVRAISHKDQCDKYYDSRPLGYPVYLVTEDYHLTD